MVQNVNRGEKIVSLCVFSRQLLNLSRKNCDRKSFEIVCEPKTMINYQSFGSFELPT